MGVETAAAQACTSCVILPSFKLPDITMPGLPNFDFSIMSASLPPLNLLLPVINIPTDPNAISSWLQKVNKLFTSWPSLPSISIQPFLADIKFPLTCPSFNLALSGITFPFPSITGTIPNLTLPSVSLPSLPSIPAPDFHLSMEKWTLFIGTLVATPFLMCYDILKGLTSVSLQMPTISGVIAKITGFLTSLGFNVPALPSLGKFIGCFATAIVGLFHQVLGV